jgi:hypothetical protein
MVWLAVVGGLLFLYFGLNQRIIWAAMRYSKIAALPIGFYLGSHKNVSAVLSRCPWSIAALVVALLATQFVYSWYAAEVFFKTR